MTPQDKLQEAAMDVLGITGADHLHMLSGDLHEELAYLDSQLGNMLYAYESFGPALLQALTQRREACWQEIQRRKRAKTHPLIGGDRYQRSKEVAKQLKSTVRIADVISKITGANPNPRNKTSFRCNCILHDDHSLDLKVSEVKAIWYCHSCHAGGDVIDLVRRYRQCTFPEAMRWLSDTTGISGVVGKPAVRETSKGVHRVQQSEKVVHRS